MGAARSVAARRGDLHARVDMDVGPHLSQALSCEMAQLRRALTALNQHHEEGILGVVLQHGPAWLDVYRGFRAVTAGLASLACILR